MARLTIVGDAVLDVDVHGVVDRLCPGGIGPVLRQEAVVRRPGGAALAASMAARDGWDVVLWCSLGRDRAGDAVRSMLDDAGVEVLTVPRRATPVKTRVMSGGVPHARLDRDAEALDAGDRRTRAVHDGPDLRTDAVLVSDYGGGMSALAPVRAWIDEVGRERPVVWDPHPLGPDPVAATFVATPNQSEAASRVGIAGVGLRAAFAQLSALRRCWPGAVAITRGAGGAVLSVGNGPPLVAPAPPPDQLAGPADANGAGDRLAVSLAQSLGARRVLSDALLVGIDAASRFVRHGGTALLEQRPESSDGQDLDVEARIEAVRRRGGTIVATGGCFDLLHPGHRRLLSHARNLGDLLVVCLNSDDSVRALKGPDRPVRDSTRRRADLESLPEVDAVVIFDEPTPSRTLMRLRPDIFVKGGDYAAHPMPEQRVLEEWGGTCCVVPFLDGYSTTDILQEVSHG